MKKAVWTIYERDDLTNKVSECLFINNKVNWEKIRLQFPDKSIRQCQQAYRNFNRTNISQNGQYCLTEEDLYDIRLFMEGNTRDWVKLKQKIPKVPMPLLLQESRKLKKCCQQKQQISIDDIIRFFGGK